MKPQGFEFFEQVRQQSRCRKLLDDMDNHVLEIVFPEQGEFRARKIISRSRARATMKYPSWKLGRMVHCESVNELRAYRLLDVDPTATAFHEQPLEIHFTLHGERHIHYPDALVQYGNSRELWEIKPSTYAQKTDCVERTKVLERLLPQLGFTYRLVIAEELAREPRMSTVSTILRIGRQPVPIEERERIRQVFAITPRLHCRDAFAISTRNGSHHICRLILEGAINVDYAAPFTSDSVLAWNPAYRIQTWGK